MVSPDLMRGVGWIRCCICGELHTAPYPRLALDIEGDRNDVCKGDCAREAGIVEAPKDWLVPVRARLDLTIFHPELSEARGVTTEVELDHIPSGTVQWDETAQRVWNGTPPSEELDGYVMLSAKWTLL